MVFPGVAFSASPHIVQSPSFTVWVHSNMNLCTISAAQPNFTCTANFNTADNDFAASQGSINAGYNGTNAFLQPFFGGPGGIAANTSGVISSLSYSKFVNNAPDAGRYYAVRGGAGLYWALYTGTAGVTFKWGKLDDPIHPWQACNATDNFSSVTGCTALATVPTFTKAFSPTTIDIGSASTLTFTVTNTNPSSLSGLNFTDTYPAGVVNGNPLAVGGTCGAVTHTATAGGSTFNLTGGTIGASTSCTITVGVTAATSGSKVNTAMNIGSTESGAGTDDAAAILIVNVPEAPTFEKAFSPSTMVTNATSTLIFTITNTNTIGLTGLNFTDAYPTGVVNGNPLVIGGTCGAVTHTATAGGSTFNLTGGTIGASTSCTITVGVTATTSGSKVNTAMNIGSTESGAGTDDATTTLTVTLPLPPAEPIPSTSIWSLGLLAGLLALVGVGMLGSIRRKHRI